MEAKHAEKKTSEGIRVLKHEGRKQRQPFKVGDSMAIGREVKEVRLWKNRRGCLGRWVSSGWEMGKF